MVVVVVWQLRNVANLSIDNVRYYLDEGIFQIMNLYLRKQVVRYRLPGAYLTVENVFLAKGREISGTMIVVHVVSGLS